MKNTRQLKILEIISNSEIETQEELLNSLRGAGINATQATISRDIKELHLHKTTTKSGKYRYSISASDTLKTDERVKYRNVLMEVMTSAVPAENIVVIKTLSGTANAAAAALESMEFGEIIGTLAGDDTLLCIFGSDRAAFDFSFRINNLFIKDE